MKQETAFLKFIIIRFTIYRIVRINNNTYCLKSNCNIFFKVILLDKKSILENMLNIALVKRVNDYLKGH
jgi:hypothetical protein